MINLMLVDDETFEIEGIKSTVNFEKLEISNVYEANSLRQAKEVFEHHPIDILICDIEMPQGNGLELIAWVKEHYPGTECIFLTCHADFTYARQAIQLGSLDYLLKPSLPEEIENVILKAIEKINKESKNMEHSRFSRLWLKHKPLVIERFWLDILNQRIPSNPEQIKKAAAYINLPGLQEMKILPVLIKVQHWYNKMNSIDEKLMEFAMKNIAEELIVKNEEDGIVIEMGKGSLLAILYLDACTGSDGSVLQKDCKGYIEACSKHLECDLSCYIGESVFDHELLDMVNQLVTVQRDNVVQVNRVFRVAERTGNTGSIFLPNMNAWLAMLEEGKKRKVLDETVEFLKGSNSLKLTANVLYQFQQDYLQMVHTFLKQKGIQAHQLFGDSQSLELFNMANVSVGDMLNWVEHITGKAVDYVVQMQKSQSVTEKIKNFILLNIDKELSNEELSNQVYLNPVYLNRIFKKDTGQSLSEYIINERLKIARELLEKTDMPVSSIAFQTGYSDYSHFSRLFRKHIGVSPVDYRKKYNINAK